MDDRSSAHESVTSRYQRAVRPSGLVAATVLAAVGVVHASWGLGSAFPFRSRAELADAVVGRRSVPSAPACHAVAGVLGLAAAMTADLPLGAPRVRRAGRAAVAVGLGMRGIAGLLGRTDAVSPGSNSPRFRRLDRRYYSPLCLALAVGVATAHRSAAAPPLDRRRSPG